MIEITEYFRATLELLRMIIYAFGALIIAWGAVESVWAFIRLRTVQHSSRLFTQTSSIRERLGLHLLLALDLFIGADLIATALHPEWSNALLLALIVAIRVVLSILLTYEIREADRFIREHEQD